MSDADLYLKLADLVRAAVPCALVTLVRAQGSVPNAIGAKMLVGVGGQLIAGTVGGGAIEHRVLAEAGEAIAAGVSRTVVAKLTEAEAGGVGMLCGGSVEAFVDVQGRPPRLILCGAGHVSLALAAMARGLEWDVTVIDDRAQWANAANYPAARVLVAAPAEALPALGVDADTWIVIATRDGDAEVLAAAAATPARYIGMVASKRKAVTVVRGLGDRVDVAALVPRLRAPVGLALGGRSPDAVALSILAELQAERHAADARPLTVDPERLLCLSTDPRPPRS
jgi:xanthine dehydrogenase accessory factor